MTRRRTAALLTGAAALGFWATAWLHSTGYASVAELATQLSSELGPVVPALWLIFSLDLAILGVIIAVVAYRPSVAGRVIVGLAALCPLGAAGLQLRFIGFVTPTAILLAIGVLALAAAVVIPTDAGKPGLSHARGPAPPPTPTKVQQ